ncbi:hypothetical protein BpHYR1_052268, partial [Brachionus plicatilis]
AWSRGHLAGQKRNGRERGQPPKRPVHLTANDREMASQILQDRVVAGQLSAN